jgi:flagellar hook assembly protein FlgD
MIYDVQGRRVKALVNETMPAGDHTIRWDGMDDAGNAVADGVYFANVRAGTVHETAKMILMK